MSDSQDPDSRTSERTESDHRATGDPEQTAGAGDPEQTAGAGDPEQTAGAGDRDGGTRGETAIVVGRAADQQPDTAEITGLAEAVGYTVVGAVTQRRHEDAGYCVGRGKAEGLADRAAETGADAVIFDDSLTPGQYANLVELLPPGTALLDRFRLVLDRFAAGAGDRRAELQVEAARLRYELPRLRQTSDESLLDRATEKGSPVLDRERRIDRLESRLAALGDDAARRRERLREAGFGLVAIAGYTNAGKSTLLHRLADDLSLADLDAAPDDVQQPATVDDRLFETLETTRRRATIDGRRVLLTDTVGLIDGLPHDLVESFSATLDAVADADAALLAVDASEPVERVREKVAVCRRTLDPGGTVIPVLTKADLVDEAALARRREPLEALDGPPASPVAVSATTGTGIDRLKERVVGALPTAERTFRLPNTGETQSLLAWTHDHAAVREVSYEGATVRLTVAARPGVLERVASRVAALGGEADGPP